MPDDFLSPEISGDPLGPILRYGTPVGPRFGLPRPNAVDAREVEEPGSLNPPRARRCNGDGEMTGEMTVKEGPVVGRRNWEERECSKARYHEETTTMETLPSIGAMRREKPQTAVPLVMEGYSERDDGCEKTKVGKTTRTEGLMVADSSVEKDVDNRSN